MDLVRGDIHWVSFPKREPRGAEIEKDRPCIIVSHQKANMFRKTVVVVPLTHGSKDAPPIIISILSGGYDSKAICDHSGWVHSSFAVMSVRIQETHYALKKDGGRRACDARQGQAFF